MPNEMSALMYNLDVNANKYLLERYSIVQLSQ